MTDTPYTRFAWSRPRGGYRVRLGWGSFAIPGGPETDAGSQKPSTLVGDRRKPDPAEPFLVPAQPDGDVEGVTDSERPEVALTLHVLGAQEQLGTGALCNFANEYGLEGIRPETVRLKRGGAPVSGVRLSRLRFEIAALRLGTELLATLTDDGPMEHFLQRDATLRSFFRLAWSPPFPLGLDALPESLRRVQAASVDMLEPSRDGKQIVGTTIGRSMRGAGWEALERLVVQSIERYTRHEWVPIERGKAHPRALCEVVCSPFGAGWYELAVSESSGRGPRLCLRCKKPFPQPPSMRRGHQRACSPKCTRWLSRKRSQVQDEKRKRLGAARIAKKLGLEERLVRELL